MPPFILVPWLFVSVTWLEAAEDAGENVPVVIHRPNRRPWVVIVYLDDLMDLAEVVGRLKNKSNNK